MLYLSDKNFCTVFKPEDKGKYVSANVSSSKKQQDGTYKNSNWSARFLGKCLDKAKLIQEKNKITILAGAIENIWDKENKKNWLTLLVFEFEFSDQNRQTQEQPGFRPMDNSEDDDNLPF